MSDEIPEGMGFYLTQLTEQVKRSKEEWVRDGPADLPPYCEWFMDNTHEGIPIPVAQAMTESDGMHPVDILAQFLPQARARLGPAWGVLFIVEGYYVKLGEKPKPTSHKRGSLAKRFAEGDASVSEAVVISMADRDDMVQRFLPFRYGDGSVIWEEQADNVCKTSEAHGQGANVPLILSLAFGEPGGDTN